MKKMTIPFLFLLASALAAQESPMLKMQDQAPLFTATDDRNETFALKDILGDQYIVIYFYPAAMTGGCTKQACSYRDMQAEFVNEKTVVIGISGDEVENLKLFREVNALNFPLLSDPDGSIAKLYGVPTGAGNSLIREINGSQYTLNRGVTARRWTFVINPQGKIVYINQQVNAETDSQEVLKVIRENKD